MKYNKTYNMRSTKESKNKMGKTILTAILSVFILIILLNSVSAVQFWKYDGKRLSDNVTSYKWGVVIYDTYTAGNVQPTNSPSWFSEITLPFNIPNPLQTFQDAYQNTIIDSIETGQPLEVYVQYDMFPKSWNAVNINNTVSRCSLQIDYESSMTNTTSTLFQVNYSTSDIEHAKYFVKMYKGDSFTVNQQCYFNSPSGRTLQIPADFTIVAPTWNCKACQFYDWQTEQVKLNKAVVLQGYSTKILENMKAITLLFYEFFIYAYWFFLILLLIFCVSLIFIALWWVYKFVDKQIK